MLYRLLYVALTAITFLFVLSLAAQNTSPYWSLAGNSTASASSKLGTTNAVPLRLITKNVARLVIDTAGRVAIGLNTPAARLHVNASATTPPLLLQINGTTKLVAGTTGGLSVGSGSSAPANGLYVAGNVGIGTNVPSRKLQVQDGDIRLQNGAIGPKFLEFVNTSGTLPDWRMEHASYGIKLYMSSSVDNFNNFTDRAYYDTASVSGYIYTVLGKARAYAWEIFSDAKLKSNVEDVSDVSILISKLKPKTYTFRQGEYAALGLPSQKQYGLIAQELEQVLPELVTTSEMPVGKSSTGERVMEEVKAVNYTALIPIMVKGMQEHQQENQALKEQVAVQQQQIDELRKMVLELKNGRTGSGMLTSAYLEQNTPNPVRGTTTIRYHVPETSTSARLTLTNAKGQLVKTASLNKSTTQISLNIAALAAGTYYYTLYIDGKQTDTKRLVISR